MKMVASNLGVTSEFSTEQFSVIMITTGYPIEESRTSEVINLEDENKSCDNLDRYELGVHGATGGVLNGKPIICGGLYEPYEPPRGRGWYEDHDGCYIFEENSWRNFTSLVGKRGIAGISDNSYLWITGGAKGCYNLKLLGYCVPKAGL